MTAIIKSISNIAFIIIISFWLFYSVGIILIVCLGMSMMTAANDNVRFDVEE